MTNREVREINMSVLHEAMADILRPLTFATGACFEIRTKVREA